MAWLLLVLAGILEVVWAFGLKQSEGFTRPLPSLITIALLVLSFYMFAKVMRQIEIDTAYAVFTGIGTAGTVLIGILFLGEPAGFWRLFFVLLLLGGIVGLKMISGDAANAVKAGEDQAGDEASETGLNMKRGNSPQTGEG
ncbi:ligand-binding protein SH3 [Paenibacillus sambharensis]|uniref:Ligand-binding protein SH3 n=1 Tax=Paenibacillus sambharensis TaxID=1803190 RepID=A0A2W1LC37_9BACL|nr:multidrug efflux SMR transporter [Paenibacillus sambharensis]PZD97758.1 ligand-binding protein SH3 [Paenibacillus sambharensis]